MAKYKRDEIITILAAFISTGKPIGLAKPASYIAIAKALLNEINEDREIEQNYHFD